MHAMTAAQILGLFDVSRCKYGISSAVDRLKGTLSRNTGSAIQLGVVSESNGKEFNQRFPQAGEFPTRTCPLAIYSDYVQ